MMKDDDDDDNNDDDDVDDDDDKGSFNFDEPLSNRYAWELARRNGTALQVQAKWVHIHLSRKRASDFIPDVL